MNLADPRHFLGPKRLLTAAAFAVLLANTASPSYAFGQAAGSDAAAAASTGTATANGLGPTGIVPVQRGFNLSLISSSLYDSGGGWSSTLSPDVAYRFNRQVSLDFAALTFPYVLADVNTGSAAKPVYTTEPRHFVLGDSTLAAHLDLPGDRASYGLTAALGLPTGNSSYGLTASHVTYTVNNHLDLSFGPVTPDFEVGIADSSVLVLQRLSRARSFTTLGKIAHFQAGTALDLPFHASFEADAYEEMPLGNQQIYGTSSGRSAGKGRGRGNGVVSVVSSQAEDNGIALSLDAPVSAHVVVSGIYGHSIRQKDDTAGFSVTFFSRSHDNASPRTR